MPIVVNDPLTWTMVALGWVFAGSACVILLSVIIGLACRLLGIWRNDRFRALLISVLLYLLAVTTANAVAYSGMTPDWPSIAMSYAPTIVAPIVAFLGFMVWPRRRMRPRIEEASQ